MKTALLLCTVLSFASHGFARLPLAPGAELKVVADGYKFTEGPAADAQGNVYFTDQPNNQILVWDAETGQVETFMKPAGRSNGLYFDHQGRLIACADEKSELWRVDVKTKQVEVLVDDYQGKLLNAPNDVWVAPDGGMYFTDPFYKRKWWTGRDKPEQEKERVYYLAKGAKELVIADEDFVRPNGIIGSEDGKVLFVADIGDGKTYRYDIGAGGKLENRKVFCGMGSDGMALDRRGNLYLTGKGVTVFDKSGRKLGNIPNDRQSTTNVCFGGKDGNLLFITARDVVFAIEVDH
ncbi:MAG: SMP-30/gluconolactonase/LRE family protein [Verrucomicrobiales bacterium]|nr:SMP-30/gluconolactonase/LRE family protein [Verrucomicrobiota bacterium JB025]